jgi:hypothetical protein
VKKNGISENGKQLFSALFNDPDRLRELYCALTGADLPPDMPVIVNTLQNVLFLGQVNDISFLVGSVLVVLIEHQSAINPKATESNPRSPALRLLLYLAKIYEKIVSNRNLYGSKLVKIPRPEFWVLYNGTAPYPDRQTLRLSDSFETVLSLGVPEKTVLELEVQVVNINEGRNADMARRCETLARPWLPWKTAVYIFFPSFSSSLCSLYSRMIRMNAAPLSIAAILCVTSCLKSPAPTHR